MTPDMASIEFWPMNIEEVATVQGCNCVVISKGAIWYNQQH